MSTTKTHTPQAEKKSGGPHVAFQSPRRKAAKAKQAKQPTDAAPTDKKILSVSGLKKSYRKGKLEVPVLHGVDLDVREGEFVAIIGQSGSGKSTLLHLLGSLDQPDAGEILFDPPPLAPDPAVEIQPASRGKVGWIALVLSICLITVNIVLTVINYLLSLLNLFLDIADKGIFLALLERVPNDFKPYIQKLRFWLGLFIPAGPIRIDKLPAGERDVLRNRYLGMIFQFYHLLPELTLLENVMLPMMIRYSVLDYIAEGQTNKQRAKRLIEMVGLSHRLSHKPRELSGGEMQRAAIARALVNRPHLLLADEPTGNLDPETGKGVRKILRTLNQEHGVTIVMVTHDMSIAEDADRVVVLEAGRIVSE